MSNPDLKEALGRLGRVVEAASAHKPLVLDTATECRATQFSDQMRCARCGLQYDVNDTDPPTCRLDGNLPGYRDGRGVREVEPTILWERLSPGR